MAPSGAGKSTLLHLAGLLEKPDGGHVIVAGRDAGALGDNDRTAIRRDSIGFVYQFHHLLGEFTALENVVLPQMIAGKPRDAARQRARTLLEAFGLGDRVDHAPGKLSGGEQQRVAIARAMANAPPVLLADEPTGNLDVATAAAVFNELLHAVRAQGVAALIEGFKDHQNYLEFSGELKTREDRRIKNEFDHLLRDGLMARWRKEIADEWYQESLDDVMKRIYSPREAVQKLVRMGSFLLLT